MEQNLKEKYLNLLNDCMTIADFCRKLKIKPVGGNYRRVKEIINMYNLDTSHLLGIHWKKGKKVKGFKQLPLSAYLVENSNYYNTRKLKERLFREGLKEEKCEECGYTENLELHHINGNPSDNRLENLRILCPNCHAKTPNFRGKNMKIFREHSSAQNMIISEEEALKRDLLKKQNRKTSRVRRLIYDIDLVCCKCNNIFHSKRYQKYCSQQCYREDNKGMRPTLLQLLLDFKELHSFLRVGMKYNISDNAVRKWCRLYGIPEKSKEMNNFIKAVSQI